VETKENTVDHALRGVRAPEVDRTRLPMKDNTVCEEPAVAFDSEPEIKTILSLAVKVKPPAIPLERLQRFSDLHKAKTAVAFYFRL